MERVRINPAGALIACLTLVVVAGLAGCNSGSSTPATGSPASSSEATPTAAQPVESTERQPGTVATASARDPRTQWIGDVPYDVFFDRPLDVYRDTTPVGSVPPQATEQEMPAETVASNTTTQDPMPEPVADPSGAAAGEGPDWAAAAPIELLNDETKELRIRLTANLQTVATYNANVEAIVNDGNILATIAAVIERHPGEVNWKEKAGHVRSLAYDIYLNAGNSGRGPFEKAKEPFEQIATILDGGPAPDGEIEADAGLSDVGDRAHIMKRIETSFGWIRADVNTEGRLSEYKERLIREASVLATLATFITDENYESASDEAYQEFIRQFVEGCRGIVQAANTGDYAAFETARNQVDNTCTPCHNQFKSADSDF